MTSTTLISRKGKLRPTEAGDLTETTHWGLTASLLTRKPSPHFPLQGFHSSGPLPLSPPWPQAGGPVGLRRIREWWVLLGCEHRGLLSTDNALKGTSWLEQLPPRVEDGPLSPNSAEHEEAAPQGPEGERIWPLAPMPWIPPHPHPHHQSPPCEPPPRPEVPSQGE